MPNDQSFFDKLLLLPLFQGIGRGEFMEIAERIRIGFYKVNHEEILVEQDEFCSTLIFVLRGEICISRESDDHTYRLTEWNQQPMVIQPEALFGLNTRYTRSYSTTHAAEFIKVDKAAVRDILFYYPTFRINYLNLVSTQMQQTSRLLWRPMPQTLPERFVRFVAARSTRPAGRKDLEIKMEQLSDELLDTRLNVSKMLHKFANDGMLEMKRRHIIIPNLEKLIQNF